MQLGLVQLIDHEADNLFPLLGHHADVIALAKAAQEVFFGPRIIKAALLNLQDLGHIAAYHPTNVDADLLFFGTTRAHFGLLPLASAREAPSVGAPRFRSRSGLPTCGYAKDGSGGMIEWEGQTPP